MKIVIFCIRQYKCPLNLGNWPVCVSFNCYIWRV